VSDSKNLEAGIAKAKERLDAHVREMVEWHFNPETGSPFWLEKAKGYSFNPRKDVRSFDDLKKFPLFEDEWLRGGPVRRWIPKGLKDKPAYVFETGGTTGIPKSRVVLEDHWLDYEIFSDTLPDEYFPKGTNWLMLGPSGPRRLRLAVEHLAHHRGGICFCVDLDPRWVVKLLKNGDIPGVKAYADHVIDQAMTILSAGHDVKCMFATPKLLEALALRLMNEGSSIEEAGITGIFAGGTEFTPQWYRFCREELLGPNVYITPTYGNTLMGLACGKPFDPADNYKIT
jgi:phenylacetate-coenzyme A ligase PaaK-like adenylate-forming protein